MSVAGEGGETRGSKTNESAFDGEEEDRIEGRKRKLPSRRYKEKMKKQNRRREEREERLFLGRGGVVGGAGCYRGVGGGGTRDVQKGERKRRQIAEAGQVPAPGKSGF